MKKFLVISILFSTEQTNNNTISYFEHIPLSFTPKKRTEIFVKRKENKISLQDSKIRNITFFSFILFLSLTCLMKSFCNLPEFKFFHFLEIPNFSFFKTKKKYIFMVIFVISCIASLLWFLSFLVFTTKNNVFSNIVYCIKNLILIFFFFDFFINKDKLQQLEEERSGSEEKEKETKQINYFFKIYFYIFLGLIYMVNLINFFGLLNIFYHFRNKEIFIYLFVSIVLFAINNYVIYKFL